MCLTFPYIFLGKRSNDPDHPDYVPTIAKPNSVSSQFSLHKAKKRNFKRSKRLKRTQERNQLLLTKEKCKNESITIKEQDENNVID